MEEFLRYVIGQIVEYPDSVVIRTTNGPAHVIFHVAVQKSDVPKLIGKGGHTIHALRTLLSASGQKRHIKATIEIVE